MISGWSSTQATTEMVCRKCKADVTKPCRYPSGGLVREGIHTERSGDYIKKIGLPEFKRRHSGIVVSASDMIKRMGGMR